ncbi:PH domain-containing protein [Corynebacterium ulcerans]|uniref:PH domain-containing protein n=1 Tax=Corynebacterium ulcerans TaxID=65058 RepID=UPI000614C389|nr:PH domain-containing protein [Corynebacterium ulcerans]
MSEKPSAGSPADPAKTSGAQSPKTKVVFSQERTHILAAGIMAAMLLLIIGAAPLYLFWLLAFPVLFIIWVLKTKTIVDDSGITAKYFLQAPAHAAWEDIQGIEFKGSRAMLKTTHKTFPLPAITFNSLPRLEEASAGRIPDVLSQGKKAADDKVVIVHRDGYQEMLTKEEFERREAAKNRNEP